jgi:hypothetical protein
MRQFLFLFLICTFHKAQESSYISAPPSLKEFCLRFIHTYFLKKIPNTNFMGNKDWNSTAPVHQLFIKADETLPTDLIEPVIQCDQTYFQNRSTALRFMRVSPSVNYITRVNELKDTIDVFKIDEELCTHNSAPLYSVPWNGYQATPLDDGIHTVSIDFFQLICLHSKENYEQLPLLAQEKGKRKFKLEILNNGMIYSWIERNNESNHYIFFPNGILMSQLSVSCDPEFWISDALIHKGKLIRIAFGWWENKPHEIQAPLPYKRKNLSTLFFVNENGMASSLCETGNTELQAYAIDDEEKHLACLTESPRNLMFYWFDISEKTLKLLQKSIVPPQVPSLYFQYAYTLFFVHNNLFLSCYKKNDSTSNTSIFSINPMAIPLCMTLIFNLNKCFDIHTTPENDLLFIETRHILDDLNKERTILLIPFFQALKLAGMMKEWRELNKKLILKETSNFNEN